MPRQIRGANDDPDLNALCAVHERKDRDSQPKVSWAEMERRVEALKKGHRKWW